MASNEGGGCGCFAFALVGLAIWHFTASPPDKSAAQDAVMAGETRAPSVIARSLANIRHREFDADAAHDSAADALAGSTYEGTVGSYNCTDDCSGHNAGWEWAQANDEACAGESEPFDEGCRAYIDAVQKKVDDAEELFNQGDTAFEK